MLKRKIPFLMIFILLLSVQGGAAYAQNAEALHAVASALSRNDFATARAAAQGTVDGSAGDLATTLYTWKFFQDDKNVNGNAGLLAQFIRNHRDWPRIDRMRAALEKNLSYDKPPKEVTAWFDDFAPVSHTGRLLYLDALLMQGRQTDVQQHANLWWAEELMSRDEQKEFYNKYASFLTTNAHRKRLDMLLYNESYGGASAVADVLGGGYPALTAARVGLAQDAANAQALVAAVPSMLAGDSGLQFEQLRWRRRHDQNVGAMELLDNMPDVSGLPNADLWWKERHIIARRLMEEGQFKTAYLLVSRHMQKEGVPFAEAEFLSGWLALRFLNEPHKALQHFKHLEAGVKTPMSKTRADYWAGRAAKAMGDNVAAQGFFQKAALHQSLFYGQLAGAEIGLKSALSNAAPPILSAQDKSAMQQNEFIRVATAFAAAQDEDDAKIFLRHFVSTNETAKAYMFAAQMASDMGYWNEALKIAKQASGDGLFLMAQAYPLITGEMQDVSTEWALVHAIIRQESMFDPSARSPAGALGLMQLMPGTASDTARKLGMAHDVSWLTTRPSYNIRLGSQYLQDMVQRFGGSYPLAIAAYNAGPRRVDGWLETFGDPRTGHLDLVDWIELIPISETRNYVQRVLEGVYAYRLRLLNTQPTPHANIHVAMK